MLRRSPILCALLILVPAVATRGDYVTTFENTGLATNSYNNNAGPSGAFTIDGNKFNNSYNPTYGSWSGWALSSTTNTTDPTYQNQYSAITGSGAGGSQTYAVADTFGGNTDPFHPAGSTISLAAGLNAKSIAITNTTYAYDAFKNGDPYGFSPAFKAGDFQKLDIQGFTASGRKVGEVDFYLANFLNGNSFILNTWATVDLTSLAGATTLQFGLTSSQNDPVYGLNPPAYFAIDNFTTTATPAAGTVPEPGSLALAAMGLGIGALLARRRSPA